MLNLLYIGELLNGLVIAASQPVHDFIFPAAGLNADDNLVSLFPLPDVLGNHIHRVLEIRHHLHHAVPRHLEHPVVGRIKLAKIPGIENGLNPAVLSAQSPDQGPGVVGGIIVNEYQLKGVFRQVPFHGLDDRLADGDNIFLLVIAGN